MAKLVFKTKYAPEEECMAIRCLLVDNDIPFHETGAGLLGMSVAGLWVDEEYFTQTRNLIEVEQAQRQQQVQQEYSQSPKSFVDMIKAQPLKWFASILAILALLALVILPFFYFQA